jgi:hypothetical protein
LRPLILIFASQLALSALFYVLHGRGRKSGAEVAMQGAQLFRWHDDLGVYGKTYAHREDALGDLGLSEDALEPIAP